MAKTEKKEGKGRARRQCPICGEQVEESADSYPFCSDRCRTIDLGRWADGSYVISRPLEQRDLDEE